MATFIFYGALNDFLPRRQRNSPILHATSAKQAVKDAIEALGIPHPEIKLVLVNKQPVEFLFPLPEAAVVEVFPFSGAFPEAEKYYSLTPYPAEKKFVLDVHLGKLAKYLRLLGDDTVYRNNLRDKIIAELAGTENRIVLTRDVGLLKNKRIKFGYWLRSQHLEEQLREVVQQFNLKPDFAPFTRCILCNGIISAVPKENVLHQLPPNTRQYFQEFYQCAQCGQVYWKGSHYQHMLQQVQRLFPD